MLRQQWERVGQRDFRCLADYVAPVGTPDYIGAFALTAGHGCDELAKRVEELEEKLNEQITENIELRKVTDEVTKEVVFSEVSEGLAATQIEKLQTLAEGVQFDDEDSFKQKLLIIKENYFPSDKKVVQLITEDVEDEQPEQQIETRGQMGRYVQAISRTIKK